MKIHDVEQGTLDWLKLRLGRPTASEFARFLTSDFELRKPDTVRAYIYEKVAEGWSKSAAPSQGSWATEQGQILEDEARSWYEMKFNCDLRQVGFIESEDGRSGCSPDALCGEAFGVEIKCPQRSNHVRYVCEGRVPLDYVTQVHGSLYVTGLPEWRFLSYNRGFPALHLIVKRDEEIMGKIGKAITAFATEYDKTFDKLKQAATPTKPKP